MKLGRDVIFDYLRDVGVNYLFGVPGTNEIPMIDGTSVPGNNVEYVPCLHENIAVGAAMGYARMTGKPGVVQLHVTPGAGHSLGNLYNAYKSHIPLVVLCGQQHSELLLQEPILASDLVQVAQQYTKWAYEVRHADELPMVLQRAFKEALTPPCRPVFLSIPWDLTIAPVQNPGLGRVTRVAAGAVGNSEAVGAAGARLAAATNPVIVAGDGVGASGSWPELAELAAGLGAPVYTEAMSSYLNYPNDLPHWQGELLTSQAGMQAQLAEHDVAFLCGFNAQAQVVVFQWARGPLIPASVTQVYLHNDPWEIGKNHYGEVAVLGDIKATLPLLIEAVTRHPSYDAAAVAGRNSQLCSLADDREQQFRQYAESNASAKTGDPIAGAQVATELAALQQHLPTPLVFVNEAISDATAFQKYLSFDAPTGYFCVEGGSLGYSMPASIGIKLAVGPDRTVVNAVGDGSALFYPHTWWTTTRFTLPILYIVMNNREYKTLIGGLDQIRQVYQWIPTGDPWYLRLQQPQVSFVQLAAGFGVDGTLVSEPPQLSGALAEGLAAVAAGRPYVVEVLTDPTVSTAAPVPRLDVLFASRGGNDEYFADQAGRFGPP